MLTVLSACSYTTFTYDWVYTSPLSHAAVATDLEAYALSPSRAPKIGTISFD